MVKKYTESFFKEMGKKGGKAGWGDAKRRGDSAYYKKIGRMRKKKHDDQSQGQGQSV